MNKITLTKFLFLVVFFSLLGGLAIVAKAVIPEPGVTIPDIGIILEEPYQTPAPVVTVEETEDAVVITATGEGVINIYVKEMTRDEEPIVNEPVATGEGEATYSIMKGEEAKVYAVWATAQRDEEALVGISETQHVDVPALDVTPEDPHATGYWLVTYTLDGEEVWDEFIFDKDNYTMLLEIDYNIYGMYAYSIDPRPNISFRVVANGVDMGAVAPDTKAELGNALLNPTTEGDNLFYLEEGMEHSYNMGLYINPDDGQIYVYAAVSGNGQFHHESYTLNSCFDFYNDGFYYIIEGNDAYITYNTIFVDVRSYYYYEHFVHSNYSYPKVVTIPNLVIHDETTYEVSKIGEKAFFASILQEITIPNSIKFINGRAFDESHIQVCNLVGQGEWQAGALHACPVSLSIGTELTAIKGLEVAPEEIFCHAKTPPVCDECTFQNFDAILHVPATSLSAYFTSPYWCNFSDIRGDVDAVEPSILRITPDSLTVAPFVNISDFVTTKYNNEEVNTGYSYSTNESVLMDYAYTMGPGECDYVTSYDNLYTCCHITVVDVCPKFSQDTLIINISEGVNLEVSMEPSNVIFNQDLIKYYSTNTDVAIVENGVVTPVSPGECDIVTYYDDDYYGEYYDDDYHGNYDVCHVVVIDPVVQISLDKNEASVLPNHIITLTPTTTPISTELVVTSSAPTIAAARLLNGKIQIVGISEGETTITVSSADGNAVPATCLITVYTEVCDVNCDGYLTIEDVVLLIDYLLSGNDSLIKLSNADADADGNISISDVTMMIDRLLMKD